MTRLELPMKDLTFSQKLDLMETLWANMIGNEKNLESPAWHETILNERKASFKTGKITASDWVEAKERIKKNSHEGKNPQHCGG